LDTLARSVGDTLLGLAGPGVTPVARAGAAPSLAPVVGLAIAARGASALTVLAAIEALHVERVAGVALVPRLAALTSH
jgi:hypothetical protein